jgi:hypothetical protein
LYLIFHTDPHADSVRLALALLEVMTAVTRLDRKQGGDGFTQTVHDQRHDRIVLALTPERRDVERIAKVAAAVNRKRGIRLPADLTEIRAVVS